MALPALHPISLEYTADPRPSSAEFHRDGRIFKGSLSFGFGAGCSLGAHLARLQLAELIDFFLDPMPEGAGVDADGITWDPRNLLLREIMRMPIRVR